MQLPRRGGLVLPIIYHTTLLSPKELLCRVWGRGSLFRLKVWERGPFICLQVLGMGYLLGLRVYKRVLCVILLQKLMVIHENNCQEFKRYVKGVNISKNYAFERIRIIPLPPGQLHEYAVFCYTVLAQSRVEQHFRTYELLYHLLLINRSCNTSMYL